MRAASAEVVRSLPGMGDTIVAIATARGRGAVAIVRLSGDRAIEIACRHVSPWVESANEVHLADVHDGRNNILDHALISVFRAPHSFTGEDVVELATHGGAVVPETVVAALMASGARQATAGEFTRRAVMNGKIDVMQAEAIADLVDAQSRSMQKAALSQMDGALSRRIQSLREALLELEAFLAYDIDFPEEDDGPISREQIAVHARTTLQSLRALVSTGSTGELLRQGAVVVIAGPPNVGKSSLFNALLGHARAIVTDIPGTTRDALEAVLDAEDFPIRLVDTAGIRDSTDYIEQLGIEVSKKYLSAADVVIACGESSGQLETTMEALAHISSAPLIPVITKNDLVTNSYEQEGVSRLLTVSTKTGKGISDLLGEVARELRRGHPVDPDTPMLTRSRHLAAVTAAASELEDFLDNWEGGRLPATVAAIHVRAAASYLEELIGFLDIEHVLDKVFGSFCVGK